MRAAALLLASALASGSPAIAQEPSARNIVDRVETLLWGRTVQGASMMLQPWMGSDFTNDDLVKQSSVIDDYTSKILREEAVAGAPAYVLELIPKPDAAVVWGKIVYWAA